MNTKIIYAVGIGIIVIGLVFYFSNSGFFASQNSQDSSNNPDSTVSTQSDTNSINSQIQDVPSSESQPLVTNTQDLNVTLDTLDILPINDELRLQLAFDVYNPNRGSAILEFITFNVYQDGLRISSGDIGAEVAGFVDSLASVYTLIGNQSITLRGSEPLTREGSVFFDSQGNYLNSTGENNVSSSNTSSPILNVNGTYAYTLNRGSDAQAREQTFSFPYSLESQ